MTTKNNPVLGYIDCGECGRRCSVHQAKGGRGKFLYTRCDECKADQRTGAQFQTRLWYQTQWLDGPPEVMPANVIQEDWTEDEEPAPIEVDEPAAAIESKSHLPGVLLVGAIAVGAGLAIFGGQQQ